MSDSRALAGDVFVRIGRLGLKAGNHFCIAWERLDTKSWRCTNYAYVVGGNGNAMVPSA